MRAKGEQLVRRLRKYGDTTSDCAMAQILDGIVRDLEDFVSACPGDEPSETEGAGSSKSHAGSSSVPAEALVPRATLTFANLCRGAYWTAVRHGFQEPPWQEKHQPNRQIRLDGLLARLTLIGTEVAEAAEAVLGEDFDNFVEELVDVHLRTGGLLWHVLMEHCEAEELRDDAVVEALEGAVFAKMAHNEKRPHLHGGNHR